MDKTTVATNSRHVIDKRDKRDGDGKSLVIDPTTEYMMTAGSPNLIPTVLNNTSMSTLPINVDLNTLLDNIGHSHFAINSEKVLHALYRDIYYFDAIGGSAVDMISGLPFSEFSIGGISDKVVGKVFSHTVERLNVRTLMPEISVDYLVLGQFIGSLLYDKSTRTFTDIMTHPAEAVEITPLPFYSQDPILEVSFPDSLKSLFSRNTGRIDAIKKKYGAEVIAKIISGRLELDPLSAIYIPRRTFSHSEGTSYFKRILPLWLLEKNLFRGTLIESSTRQRGIMHLTLGDGESWEPSSEDMEYITELFQNASADPLGAIIATRLGVSVEEVRCIAGDTLISTSDGLIRIDEMVNHDPAKMEPHTAIPVDYEVKGLHGEFVKADLWWYQGVQDTYQLRTESGVTLSCTENHRFVTLQDDGSLGLTLAKDLMSQNKLVCFDTKGMSPVTELPLNLTDLPYSRRHKVFTRPKVMTVELAYTLGIVLSDGMVSGNVGKGRISVFNSSLEILEHFKDCMDKVFNATSVIRLKQAASSAPGNRYLKGHKIVHNKDGYIVQVGGDQLVNWFTQLGMLHAGHTALIAGNRACLEYIIPNSIILSDRQCRLAFIAGFIDGDGYVHVEKTCAGQAVDIQLCSGSPNLLKGLQSLLIDLGYQSQRTPDSGCVYLNPSEGCGLYNEIYPYLQSPDKKPFDVCDSPASRKNGIPAKFVVDLIKSRKIRNGCKQHGACYKTDDGRYVNLFKVSATFAFFMRAPNYSFSYAAYQNGSYDAALDLLKQISLSCHNRLVRLLEMRLRFEKVVAFDYSGKQPVYDLTIAQPNSVTTEKEGKIYRAYPADKQRKNTVPPIYAANGILSKNSANDFWKWTDISDQMIAIKLKALGISESIVTAEASFSNMENALSLFVDHLRSYRDMITRKFFYNKLFPLISVINGYGVDDRGKFKNVEPMLYDNVEDTLAVIQDGSGLLIPTVHWAKQLKPEGDTAYFDILDRLTQAGVPVPMRVIAAAGGFNMDDIINQEEDDLVNRATMGEYMKKLAAVKKKYGVAPPAAEGEEGGGGEGGGFDGFSSATGDKAMLTALASASPLGETRSSVRARKPKLLNRFNGVPDEIVGRTRTGKRKAIYDQHAAHERANDMIVKALRNQANDKSSPLNSDSITPLRSSR
jgi:hypothetical protein